ncbi:HTH-type transcriptional regulator [Trabulsiella odontotermitis]|uniref:Transcriptional regulator n=1 Tax=Trabulsiella odontotermitis TaxID=379893 RepID=A0A0L0GQK3_9ENTR|nr:HTH-type transcriptional regulator [Trabulsiella odontotermitis]KNC91129.1 transcriptional regulator [Trabulsiella odontotermitis]KNC95088.1 transcriptional regulator [Trabulsiella odontotermitis]
MEYKDPEFDLLGSLEQIVFKDASQFVTLKPAASSLIDFEQLRKGTGLKLDEFARAMGVSVTMVKEWESKRVRPSATELNLMRLMQANPQVSRLLTD